jgi:hypothetical protein
LAEQRLFPLQVPFSCATSLAPEDAVSIPPCASLQRLRSWRSDGLRHRMEALMGDKSPKSKQRDQKQKHLARAAGAAEAKAKQDSHSHAPLIPAKGRK